MEEGGRTYFANTRLAPDQASGSNPKGKSAKKNLPSGRIRTRRFVVPCHGYAAVVQQAADEAEKLTLFCLLMPTSSLG